MNATELARLAFRALETGDAALSRRVLTEDHVNHMAADEPPACREHGAPGFLATSAWLRLAFSELSFEELDVVASGDQVVSHVRMSRGPHRPVRGIPAWRQAPGVPRDRAAVQRAPVPSVPPGRRPPRRACRRARRPGHDDPARVHPATAGHRDAPARLAPVRRCPALRPRSDTPRRSGRPPGSHRYHGIRSRGEMNREQPSTTAVITAVGPADQPASDPPPGSPAIRSR